MPGLQATWCFPSDHKRDASSSIGLPGLLNPEDTVQALRRDAGSWRTTQTLSLFSARRGLRDRQRCEVQRGVKWLNASAERCQSWVAAPTAPAKNPPLALSGARIKIQTPCLICKPRPTWSLPTSPAFAPTHSFTLQQLSISSVPQAGESHGCLGAFALSLSYT